MSREDWTGLESLLDDALALAPPERDEFLKRVDAEDPQKGRLLRELVDNAQSSSLEDLRKQFAGAIASLATRAIPERVGHFRIVRLLDAGGMGDVYEAEQIEPVRRTVALKLVKQGLFDREAVARFEAERQTLALLTHPNIAQIFEAGVAEDGRPFLAMEYIAGVAITSHCDLKRWSVRRRLQLFLDVCAGVEHAHRKSIIHRDLKPSNILVTEVGDRTIVKIIDFGIAKALAPATLHGASSASMTTAGQSPGTHGYMSPEQADPANADVDTQTDVYALGVLLYELLSGLRPFQEFTGSDPRKETPRLLQEPQVPRPTSRLRREPERFARAAANRGATVTALRREIRGDLESIVLKALEKDRSLRYASVADLARDITRRMAHEPVTAQSATALYRARKFARRHRAWLAVAAIFLALVAGFGINSMRQLQETRRERDKAEAINGFLQQMLGTPSPFQGAGKEVTVVDAIGDAVKRIDESFKGEPEIKASVLDRVGHIYYELGRYAEARPLLERALRIREDVHGPDHAEIADTLEHLGLLAAAEGALELSEKHHRHALAMIESVSRAQDARVAQKSVTLADILESRGSVDEAERLYRHALAILRDAGEERRVAATLSSVATLHQNKGSYVEAERAFRESIAILQRVLGGRNPEVATGISNLSVLFIETGKYDAAERHQRDALAIRRAALGDMHPDTWQSMNNLAVALWNQGKYDEAEPLFSQALAYRRNAFGSRHPFVASNAGNLGMLLFERGDFEAAEPLLREALETRKQIFGTNHLNVVVSLNNLGVLLGRRERYEEAEQTFREALAIAVRLVGEEHADYARGLNLIADVLCEQGRAAEAEPLARRALELRQKLTERDGPDVAQSLMTLGNVLVGMNQPAAAEAPLRLASEIFSKKLRQGHWRRAAAAGAYGECLFALGRVDEAEKWLVQARPGVSAAFGAGHSRTLRLERMLSDLQRRRAVATRHQ